MAGMSNYCNTREHQLPLLLYGEDFAEFEKQFVCHTIAAYLTPAIWGMLHHFELVDWDVEMHSESCR